MKKGIFVFNPNQSDVNYNDPWTADREFNSREFTINAKEGLALFKKNFSIKGGKKAVKSVVVRATALGIFDIYVNGVRIGERTADGVVYDELKPGWTDYRFRVFEFEYTITDDVKADNSFVALVSGGWWRGRNSYGYYKYKKNAFCAEIEVTYKDGTSEIFASGKDWECSVGGPVLLGEIWDGEYYDSRIPHPAKNPEAHEWSKCDEFTDFLEGKVEIVPCQDKIRVKKYAERRPISAVVHSGTVKNGSDFGKVRVFSKAVGAGCEEILLKKGKKIILDMGQNMVGVPEITIRASKGTKITGMFAEMLNDSGEVSRGNDGPEGSLYVKNYRTARARFVYVASGKKSETYAPAHTFYGFRYLEISADANIRIFGVRGLVIGSEMKETAGFECDNADINQLWSNIVWGMRGNYLSVPTDCPQRDERFGWTGDTQIFCGAGNYLADAHGFLKKWLVDAEDSQKGYDGAYCAVVPRVWDDPGGDAAWADAGIVVTHRLWLVYNDVDVVARQYKSMEDYMRHLEKYGMDGPRETYGDWLCYDVTDKRYIAVCYYKYDADTMAFFSDLLGKSDRAKYYRELSAKIKASFAERYIENGTLTQTTQTAYLLALAFNMLDEKMSEDAKVLLRKKIEENNYTLSTGFVGTGILNQTLAKFGMNDLAYSLLLQTADPSWLYSVHQGATTVWERWNSYTLATGFGDVGMNSFNHYAYGAVAEWIMAYALGIRADENAPGYKHFILAPEPDGRTFIPEGQKRLNKMKGWYDSPCGKIESAWEYKGDGVEYKFTVPEGTTATVILNIKGKKLKVNGLEFKASELGEVSDGKIKFELKAGNYVIA